jgi:hypothetical protein
MAAGMWQGLLAGYKDVEEKIAAREAKEEEIFKRRRTLVGALRPKIESGIELAQTQVAQASLLKNRGISGTTLDAMGQNPDKLKAAYDFVTSGDGVDLPPEKLNAVFKATIIGDTPPEDIFQSLQNTLKWYEGVEGAEDVETYMSTAPTRGPITSAIEVRLPKEVKAGLDPRLDGLYKLQVKVFEDNLLTVARRDFNRLQATLDDAGELPKGEAARLAVLRKDLNSFATNPNSRLELRGMYGQQALEALLDSDIAPETLSGIETNPYLFLLDEEEGAGFRTTPVDPVVETPEFPEGTYEDATHFYIPIPTGGYRKVPKV